MSVQKTISPVDGRVLVTRELACGEEIERALVGKGLGDKVTFRLEDRGLVLQIVSDDVLFDLGKADLRPEGRDVLDGLVPALQDVPNQLAVEGFQAVARRQVEIARQVMEEFSSVVRDFTSPGSPEDRIAKQAELSKTALEKSVANARRYRTVLDEAGELGVYRIMRGAAHFGILLG